MQLLRSARWMALALLLCLIPVSSHAGVLISVAIAPPVMPAYDQPPCPEPGWIWTPGYWAYDYDNGGYYWIPGTWVPAPYVGALWTPGYWGWETGVYIWHPGYWGRHVGYYGGVNYGFGYFGIGFAGGEWRGNVFAYNTAVMHVNGAVIRNVYVDRDIIQRNTIGNDRRVAYAGGPGGIRHDPTPDERNFMREQHMQPTNLQQQHMNAARQDRSAFYNNNHGRPANVTAARPMSASPANNGNRMNNSQGPQNQQSNQGNRQQYNNAGPQSNIRVQQPQRTQQSPQQIQPQPSRQQAAPQQQQQQMRSQPQQQQLQQPQRSQQQQQQRTAPQSRPQPEAKQAPQSRQQAAPQKQQQQQHNDSSDRGKDR